MKTNEGIRRLRIKELCLTAGVFLSFLLLSTIVFSFFSPIVKTNAADSDTVGVSAVINPVLSVSAPSSISLSDNTVTPTTEGTFVSNSGTVTVTTNDTSGYYLYIASSTSETSLTASGSSTPIEPCASGATSSSMVSGHWGYSTDSGATYEPITSSDVPIKTSSSISDNTKEVYFGSKISTDTESGNYSIVVKFTGTVR